jgi:hypothetical protein
MTDLPSAGRELDTLIAEKVMGRSFDTGVDHPVYGRGGLPPWGGFAPGVQGLSVVPHYSTDIAAAWQIVLLMVSRMGYDNIGFNWQGPLFKPEHHYLTQEGYPLGTTCWFVHIEHDGYIKIVCADTPELAICRAALEVNLREPAKRAVE